MFYDGVTIGSKSVATALAEQTAQFYGQAAEEWKHHAAWVAQSQHAHVPAPYVGQETAAQQRQTDAAFQARSAGAIRAAQGVPGNLAAVKPNPTQLYQQVQVQQSEADREELRREVRGLYALVAKQEAIRQQQAQQQAQVQRAQPQKQARRQVTTTPRPTAQPLPLSPYTGRPSSLRAMINRSVGLPGEYGAPVHQDLPISPETGKPSSIRAMIERSVGMRG